MYTFKDLEFKPHPIGLGLAARMKFENGYGISVVRFSIGNGYGSYTDSENEWEVAVLHKNQLTYDTPITDDVIGHCSKRKVTSIMKKIQRLKKKV